MNFDELPSVIRSLFDSAKPLAELQTDKPSRGFDTEAQLKSYLGDPPPGYAWHHIIEQNGQFRPDLTSPEGVRTWIQNTDNMVTVPVIKHYCINGFMSRAYPPGSGFRLRDIVKAHNAITQRGFGFDLLKACGGNPMSDQLDPNGSDEQIVSYIRHWAVEHGKCGLDSDAANLINERHVIPAGRILGDRGPASLAKLLPLLNDADQDVRLTAASLAYDVDTPACRTVLEDLLRIGGVVGLLAWVMLSHKDFDATPPIDLWGTKSVQSAPDFK